MEYGLFLAEDGDAEGEGRGPAVPGGGGVIGAEFVPVFWEGADNNDPRPAPE